MGDRTQHEGKTECAKESHDRCSQPPGMRMPKTADLGTQALLVVNSFKLHLNSFNILYGHPVNTAKFFWPISDHINRVPLYLFAGEANKFYKFNSFPSKVRVMYVASVSIVTVK